MLIYRYFGGVEELIARYIFQKDYWINISIESDKIQDVNKFLKTIFRKQILLLREDIIIKRLYRWELSINNSMINEIRAKRESNGCQLVDIISKLTKSTSKEVASLASIISASISYMALLEELNPIYNGIDLQSNAGWEQIAEGIDLIVDLWLKSKEK